VICISSGGKLKEKSWEKGIKHVNIPNLSVPRASLPYLVMPGLTIIRPLLKSMEHDAKAMYHHLSKIRDEISMTAKEDSNRSKRVAEFLVSGFPFCFVSPYLAAVGTRFKNSLNENAKMHCLKDSVLEASHNEIVPFTFDNGIDARILLLEWNQDPALVKERFEKIRALCRTTGQPTFDLSISAESMMDAIISSIYMLDYASIYMAISRGIDPSPTPAIDILKESRP
jgi:glucose/mannose-6-phosphate isomerase